MSYLSKTTMTNQQKISQLLQIAQENGWEDTTRDCNILLLDNMYLWNGDGEDNKFSSLNDLVTNFEPNEVSFLEALCIAANLTRIDLKNGRGVIYSPFDKGITSYVREGWNLEYTSKRLEWLFVVFENLLN